MMLPRICYFLAALTFSIDVMATPAAITQRADPPQGARQLLKESMDWMDMYYDADAGYLYSLSAAALTHETRASSWYAAGLLARNEGDDVEQAVKIVENIIEGQHKNRSTQW
jgi:hypothetical protein